MKPVVDGLQQSYGERIDFVVYADLERDSRASAFAQAQGVTGVPTSMLVAADGRELRRWQGVASRAELQQAFDAALSP